jgi:hypothetical protein
MGGEGRRIVRVPHNGWNRVVGERLSGGGIVTGYVFELRDRAVLLLSVSLLSGLGRQEFLRGLQPVTEFGAGLTPLMSKKKWVRCWAGPCPRWTRKRNLNGRRHPSGPHGRWPRAFGMDIRWNETAALWAAVDPATDMMFLFSEQCLGNTQPAQAMESTIFPGISRRDLLPPHCRSRCCHLQTAKLASCSNRGMFWRFIT